MAKNSTTIEITLQDGQVQSAVTRVNNSLQSIEDKAKKLGESSGGFDQFAGNVKAFIQDPLHSAGDAVEGLLLKLGPSGALVTGAAAGFAAIGKYSLDAMRSLGELGHTYENFSLRTGIATADVGKYAFAAKMAGEDTGIFESAMRKLTIAQDDNGEAGAKVRSGLERLGVSVKDIHGNLKTTQELFEGISAGLNKLDEAAGRGAMVETFGKNAITLLPVFKELNANLNMMHWGPDAGEIARFKLYHDALTVTESKWEAVWRRIKDVAGLGAIRKIQ
jgi:hypothetical protein